MNHNHNKKLNKNRFKNYSNEVKELIILFESTGAQDGYHYFDEEQMETIIDFYLETYDLDMMTAAVKYAKELFPDSSDIELRRAHMLCAKEKYDEALAALHDLEIADPTDTDVLYAIGTVYSAMEQPRKAVQYYLRTSKDGYDLDMVYGNIADEYAKMGAIADAVTYYKHAIKVNPNETRSILNLARCYANSRNVGSAVSFFSTFVKDNPYSAEGWLVLGQAYVDAGLYERAEDALQYAITISQDYLEAYDELAHCYMAHDKQTKAIDVLHDALKYTDDASSVYVDIADCFMDLKNYTTAAIYYKKALDDDPYYAEACTKLADCYAQLGDYQAARDTMQRVIEQEPAKAEYYIRLGNIHAMFDHMDMAKEALDHALSSAGMEDYWINTADMLLHKHEWESTIVMLEKGIQQCADEIPFRQRLSVCYFHTQQHDKMMECLRIIALGEKEDMEETFSLCPDMRFDPDIMDLLRHLKENS